MSRRLTMKPGDVLGRHQRLAEALAERRASPGRSLVGGQAAHDLDQLHHRHRVHEVHADDLLRPLGLRAEQRDRDRRGVRREDRARLHGALSSSLEDLLLRAPGSRSPPRPRRRSRRSGVAVAGADAARRSRPPRSASSFLPSPPACRAPRTLRHALLGQRALASTSTTSMPACAATCAMPRPSARRRSLRGCQFPWAEWVSQSAHGSPKDAPPRRPPSFDSGAVAGLEVRAAEQHRPRAARRHPESTAGGSGVGGAWRCGRRALRRCFFSSGGLGSSGAPAPPVSTCRSRAAAGRTRASASEPDRASRVLLHAPPVRTICRRRQNRGPTIDS